MKMNAEAYEVVSDNLIYDSSHPIDATNVKVSVPADSVGSIFRGEVLDFSDGKYVPHTENGTASVIAAECTSFAADDTEVVVPVYISGCFRKSACSAGVELTETDVEMLRTRGIYLK